MDICDVEKNLSGFKLNSFRLSLVLHLLGRFLHFWKGRTLGHSLTLSPSSRCCYPFHFLLPDSVTDARLLRSESSAIRSGTKFHQTIKNDFTVQGEGILLGVIPKEADKHKKANQPKWITKLTSNQTKNHLLQFQGWTATGASCSFSGSWCHSIFDAFCVSFFLRSLLFLLELFLLRASQARLCGSR